MTPIFWVLATGCNSVSGTVDAYDTPINTAVYVELEDAYGDDEGILVLLASHGLSCEEWADFEDDYADAVWDDLTLDDAADVWRETLPEDFWDWAINIRVDRLGDKLKGDEWEGVDWQDGLTDDDEAKIVATHYTDWPEEEDILTGLVDVSDTYRSDDGTMKIQAYSEGKSIRGKFETQMVDNDGSDEGDITLRFSADRCEELEREWDL
ncbi:MAG: hypothetical protein GY913_33220 [Proteobacteria bacterium]|nr:hypothetical protein [Pseudomonadota bacterium]MCP4921787.1 hypothetical protein [Pseudomonadota bacterium]